jgi:hypothetical protein
MPDPGRFLNFFGNPIVRVAGAAKESKPGLQFSESLWAQGNAEAAIRAEGLTKSDTQRVRRGLLCGYSLSSVQTGVETYIFQEICAKHSAVYSR